MVNAIAGSNPAHSATLSLRGEKMKQIEECLDRVFQTQKPLKKKWRAFFDFNDNGEQILLLYHYQHLILVLNMRLQAIEYIWYEKDADKRGLISAINYLVDKKILLKNKGLIINIYNILIITTGEYRAKYFLIECFNTYMEDYSRG